MLHRYHSHYKMLKVSIGYYSSSGLYTKFHERELKEDSCVEYSVPPVPHADSEVRLQLKVSFESTIYGTFTQCVLFDFGRRPHLLQRLNIDVEGCKEILDELLYIRKDITLQVWKKHEQYVGRILRLSFCVSPLGNVMVAKNVDRIWVESA